MYGRVNGTVQSRLLKIEGTFGPQWNCLTDHSSVMFVRNSGYLWSCQWKYLPEHSSITFVGNSGYLWSCLWNCLTMSQRSSEML